MNGRLASAWHRAGLSALASLVLLLPLAAVLSGYDFAAAKSSLLEAGALVLLVTWALKGLERGRWELPDGAKPLLEPAALLFAWTLARFLGAPHKAAALPGLLHQLVGLAAYAAVVLEFGGSRESSRLTGWLLASAWAVGLYALLQRLGLDPLAWRGSFGTSVFSTLGTPELLAVFLAGCLPLALSRLADPERHAVLKAGDALLAAVMTLAVLWTGAPWGQLAFAVSALLSALSLSFFLPRRAGAGAAAFALAVGLSTLAAGTRSPAFPEDLGLDARGRSWTAAVRLAAARPLIGTGPGSFWLGASALPGRGPVEGRHDAYLEHAGSEPLEVAAELGLPGLALWLWLVAAWAGRGWRARRAFLQQAAFGESLALSGLVPAAGALLLASLLTPASRYAAPGWLFWPLAGLAGGMSLLTSRRASVAVLPLPLGAEARRWLYAPALFALGLAWFPASWLLSDLRYNRAVALARADAFEAAAAEASLVTPGAPSYAAAQSLAGASLLRADRPDEALAALSRLEASAPDFPLLQYRLGLAHARKGEWTEAIARHERQRELDPFFVPNWTALSSAAREAGDLARARQAAYAAAALEPKEPAHLLRLAGLYAQEKRVVTARRLQRAAARLKRPG